MSDLTANPAALVLGAVVGAGAGLYAHRAAGRAVASSTSETGTNNDASYIPPTYALTSIGATAGLLVGARFGTTAALPAYLFLVAIAPALGVIDAVTRRLPNFIVLPSYPLAALLLGFAAWRAGNLGPFWRAWLAGATTYALLLVIALAAPPRAFGWADVKLSGLVGGFLGFLGWSTLLRGMTIAFVSAAVYVVLRAVARLRQRGQALPLGPALLSGALLAVILS
ncbi:prepilin peptidase [Catenulispora sp. NF23]|uniref:prepilin peptidase n=1 Tax=Catenulispora pinistramenti TaxID=2705254 RepID=UPI001BAAB25B|nr:A24 family peptidase [Catenulispora pinistramenti]MBS2533321.1 prepilin peptidase [Catenulispora pinistramenti]